MKTRLAVVVDEKGDVVATHAPDRKPAGGSIQVQARLGTGPGQVLHEIEFEVPDSFQNEKEIVEFHRRIRDHILQDRKRP
jgi:hypothetical protein